MVLSTRECGGVDPISTVQQDFGRALRGETLPNQESLRSAGDTKSRTGDSWEASQQETVNKMTRRVPARP